MIDFALRFKATFKHQLNEARMMNEKPTILTVDDSENDLFLMRLAFKKADFDCALLEVGDGAQAIAYLKGEGPNSDRAAFPLPTVMLLDLNMPITNGFEVLEWLRGQPGLKRLTVIVLTASMRAEDAERALDLGANWFIVKPSDIESLVAMIRTLRDWMQFTQFPSLTEAAKK
jgi:CheY-like chemotaxis protein